VRRNAIVLGLVVMMAAGCSLSRPSLERHSFSVEAERSAQAAPARNPEPFPVTLKVGRISVQPPYGGTSFIYRTGALQYEVDPYNSFVASPGDLLGQQIARWLSRAGLFTAVREPESPLTGDYVLEGLVTALYGDARDPQRAEAVLSIKLYARRARAEGGLVFEQAYAQRVAIEDASPEALARGYGLALGRILDALERDLARLALTK
jgi:cholesterol transport system auxiliary component